MMISEAVNPTTDERDLVLNGIAAAEIRSQLDLILRSRTFIQSHRIRRFLQFVVEESLLGQPHRLKEYVIGVEVFDRRDAFDPRVDSIVRVEARRLRYKLEEYYRTEGHEDPVRVNLRKGSYVPTFEYRTASASAPIVSRRSIEIAPFYLINAAPEFMPAIEEMQRRLAHVLIKEGLFQVLARPQATHEDPAGNGTLGHANGADYVVEGSLDLQPDGFHLLLQLQQSADGSYVWSEAVDGRLSDLACVDQLAQLLVRELRSPAHEAVLARRQPERKESGDAYLQGRYHWKLATPHSIRDSIAYFAKAVESDPNYAAAWAAFAEALLGSSIFGLLEPSGAHTQMKDAAAKATALNPSLPEAHLALGAVLSLVDWDWAGGEGELERAIQLDSHDPLGHIAYGILLACRGALDRATTEVERALELDPAALFPNFVLGWMYGVGRRFEESISQHLLVSRLATDYGLSYLGLGLAYAGQGRFKDAIAYLTNAAQMKCGALLHGQMGYCYARLNRREEALREMSSLQESSKVEYVSPVSFATICVGLGETDQALEHLERAAEVRDTSLPVLLLGAEFDSLAGHARFQELRQRIGLVQQADAAQSGR